jgi:hypothetical protein
MESPKEMTNQIDILTVDLLKSVKKSLNTKLYKQGITKQNIFEATKIHDEKFNLVKLLTIPGATKPKASPVKRKKKINFFSLDDEFDFTPDINLNNEVMFYVYHNESKKFVSAGTFDNTYRPLTEKEAEHIREKGYDAIVTEIN